MPVPVLLVPIPPGLPCEGLTGGVLPEPAEPGTVDVALGCSMTPPPPPEPPSLPTLLPEVGGPGQYVPPPPPPSEVIVLKIVFEPSLPLPYDGPVCEAPPAPTVIGYVATGTDKPPVAGEG